jgi:hypothetical protein
VISVTNGQLAANPGNLLRLFSLYSANIAYPDSGSWKTGHCALPWYTTAATGE